MAVIAKDGTRHHSASRASLHDSMAADKGSTGKVVDMKKPDGDGAAGGMKHPAPSSHSIEDHVSDHGPAHAVHHMHDEGGDGKHHVSSFHGEAEPGDHDHPAAHHSVHASHAAAHEHMGKAMGVNAAENEDKDHEEFETPDTEQAEDARAGGGIPGIANS